MDRVEATGIGLALAGHGALLAALTLGFAGAVKPLALNEPIEVAFVDEIALDSTSPTPSAETPAAKLGEIEAPPEQVSPALPQPAPLPLAQPKAVIPAAPSKAPPKASQEPVKKKNSQQSGRLKGLLSGLSDADTDSRSTEAPAKKAGPAVQASLAAEVRRQLKPHWKAPTGADSEQLRTELSIWLSPAGEVTKVEIIGTKGQTASNRPQVKLHQEQAVRAVRLASPFRLPPEFYEEWKLLSPIGFDKRLSQ
jgi:hypothetical protein